MKKIFLAAALAALVLTSVNAQEKYKPEAMTVSTELNYSPGGATDGGFTLPEYGAKVRLHLNEKMAVRLSLGLNTTTDKTTTFYDDANQKEQESYDRTTRTTFSIMPGFEYHFTKYERISPYVGGVYLCKGLYLGFELGLGYNSLNTKRGSTTTVTGSTTNEDKGTTADLVSSFGFHATPSLRVGWCF